MNTRASFPLVVILAAALAAGAGCADRHPRSGDYDSGPGRGYGPPPHAPAHGYRHKYQDRDLEFDSNLGVYVVIDMPALFWLDGWYFRRLGDRWQRSQRWDGPWYDSRWEEVPPRLRGADGKGPGQNKGPGKDKGRSRPAL
jgi:hypothetical protein